MLADIIALPLSNFFHDSARMRLRGVIQYREAYTVAALRCLCENLILVLLLVFPCHLAIVLCHTIEHIDTFPNIGKFIIDCDAIDTSAFKLH